MKIITPKVFLIGETKILDEGIKDYLTYLGVPNWISDASTDIEKIIEIYGRLCYGSYDVSLNKNLTRVRKHNKDYLKNIIEKGDGSVLEHSTLNFIFCDVSRVFTAELCRHRVGTAISERSLRFVRLNNIDYFAPTCVKENEQAMTIFMKAAKEVEELERELAVIYELDKIQDFNKKKVITSAMRRVVPMGLATTIGWSANIRTIRHVLEMRTDPAAEEEIRAVFQQVGIIMQQRYPNLFGDYTTEEIDGYLAFTTPNKKV